VKLDYAANNFAALGRFGRVLDQLWTDYGADPDVARDEYTYTYDRAGNRLTRPGLCAKSVETIQYELSHVSPESTESPGINGRADGLQAASAGGFRARPAQRTWVGRQFGSWGDS
jgi:hypothetical protein